MAQTSYAASMDVAVAGMAAESIAPRDILTRFSTDQVAFGLGVVQGTDPDEINLPSTSAQITQKFGVALFDSTQANLYYSANAAVAMMWHGRVYVECETNIALTDAVYCRFTGKAQVQTLTFDADLITANVVNMTVDGNAITPITFAVDHNTTMAALAVEIASQAGVNTATTPGGGSRVITITAAVNGTDVVLAGILVTLGASQAAGVAAETVASIANSDIGKFRNDADSTTAALVNTAVAKWVSTAVAGGLGKLQLLST